MSGCGFSVAVFTVPTSKSLFTNGKQILEILLTEVATCGIMLLGKVQLNLVLSVNNTVKGLFVLSLSEYSIING